MNRKIILAAILLVASSSARADDLEAIITKYVAWRGGPAFEAMRSFHQRGEIRSGGLHGPFEQWLDGDGRVRSNLVLGPLSIAQAVTPNSAWTTNASGQIEDMGDRSDNDRHAASLAFAGWVRQPAVSPALLAPEDRGGRIWDVVRIEYVGSSTYDLFIAPETGELLGERITEDRKTKFVEYGDWRMVSGVRMPFEEHDRGSNSAGDQDIRLSTIEINGATPADLFARPAPPKIWSFAPGQHSTGWIDFEFFGNERIFIPATINGQPVKLLLDSGAGITVLDSGYAKKIGIKPHGAVGATGVVGTAKMELASDLRIKLGKLTLHHITAGVIDLAAVSVGVRHPTPLILGKEVFNQLIVDIDFQRHQIALRDPDGFSNPPGAVRLALGRHGQGRTVPVSVAGGAPVQFDFDLGDDFPLTIYPTYPIRAQLLEGKPQSLKLNGGVGGVVQTKVATVSSITIGGLPLPPIPTLFPDPSEGGFNSDRTAGNIGLPVFARFRLITDYPHEALWLIPDPKALAEPFPKDRSGLIARHMGDRLKVLMVAPDSPAERSGWKEGTEIVAVDGNKVSASYNGSPLSRWTTGRPGTTVTLTLADGSTRQLTLADYY
jgi:hypothetical protein